MKKKSSLALKPYTILQRWEDEGQSYMLVQCFCGAWIVQKGTLQRHVRSCTCIEGRKNNTQNFRRYFEKIEKAYDARKNRYKKQTM